MSAGTPPRVGGRACGVSSASTVTKQSSLKSPAAAAGRIAASSANSAVASSGKRALARGGRRAAPGRASVRA